jgi:FMN reductase
MLRGVILSGPNILAVVGSLNRGSVTRVVIQYLAAELRTAGCRVDVLDLMEEALPLFNPDSSFKAEGFAGLKGRVERADVFLLGTPDYHGSISSPMKNFLDHFWHEFAGKLFVTLVASHERGLTATDQLRTVARQCYAWSLPYGLAFVEDADVRDGRILVPKLDERLTMLVRDARVYGGLLAAQRRADLAGTDPGFLAKHRKPLG